MLTTNARSALIAHLASCTRCHAYFYDNVAVITHDETGSLTDEQVVDLVACMRLYHEGQHVVARAEQGV